MNILLKILIFSILITLPIYAASFDCKKASTSIEKTVCADNMLNDLDEQLSYKFNAIKNLLPKDKVYVFIKEQRKWLKVRNQCNTKNNLVDCIKTNYQKRSNILENKYKQLLSLKVPSHNEAEEICNNIAKNPNLFIQKHKIHKNNFDINNDGITEKIIKYNTPAYETPEGKQIIPKYAYEWKDYWPSGLISLQINNKVFQLRTYDSSLKQPLFLSYIDHENYEMVVCDFNNTTVENVIPANNIQNSYELCSTVDTITIVTGDPNFSFKNYPSYLGEGPLAHIKFNPTLDVNSSYFEHKYNNKWYSYKNKEASFDFDNDGKIDELIKIKHSSSDGRLCDVVYIDETDSNNMKKTLTNSRKLLLNIQELNINSSYPDCGTHSGFFEYKGEVYYEELGKHKHNILQIKDNKISTICKSSFKTITSVKNVKY